MRTNSLISLLFILEFTHATSLNSSTHAVLSYHCVSKHFKEHDPFYFLLLFVKACDIKIC